MRRNGYIVLLVAALAWIGCGASHRPPGAEPLLESASVAAAARNPVTVSPLPGTPDASPSTQISFLGPRGTRVSSVRVVGSRSGAHSGTLRGYSTGTGASFIADRPFAQGERVTVRARVAGGPRAARTSFAVARQAPVRQKPFPRSHGDPRAVQHYETAPSLTPSRVTIATPARSGATPGVLLLAPYQSAGTAGPMIADQSGGLIWFSPLPAGMVAANLAVRRYRGGDVLSWWQGRVLQIGFGQGEHLLYDSSYRRVASIRAGNGYAADLHALSITPEGTAWIDAYDPVRMNLSSIGGASDGVVSDSVVQEIDIKTGLVMWEWHALGHIPASDSKNPAPSSSYPWDYVHVNSIDPGPDGDLLLSFRNTWSIDDVDIHSGGFRWRIGGVRSTLALPRAAVFYWQHDAAFQPGGQISLFDNGSTPPKERQSRGLVLAPNLRARRVTVVKALVNPDRTLLAASQGNAQSLPGGNWLLGYGGLPNFTELDGTGRVLLDGTLGPDEQSYTVRLASWHGQPSGQPAVQAGRTADGRPQLAVSWNGATDVASWRLLLGASPGALAPAATVGRTGFQTALAPPGPVAADVRYAAAQALDAGGSVLATSATVALSP